MSLKKISKKCHFIINPYLAGSNCDLDRVKWVKKNLLELPKDQSLLDAGAGEQRMKEFCGHLQYISQDFCQYEGKGDTTGLQTGLWDTSKIDIVSDITSIPVQNNSFDAVLCTEVFEHIPDPIAAVKEFSRILKPSGTLLLTAPFCSLTHFAPYHYGTGFNRYWYEKHLTDSGFKIIEIEYNGNWFEFIGQELSRSRTVSATYASKFWGVILLIASIPLRLILKRLSHIDRGSKELLCFGLMVKAVKI